VCVCVCLCVRALKLRYPTCNAHAPFCHLWPAPLCNIFPRISLIYMWLLHVYMVVNVYMVVFLFNTVIYVFLLLCLCILCCMFMYPHRASWHSSATLLRFLRAFSSVVRQMPGYNPQRPGTARTLPKLLCSIYCLFCVVLCIVCV
jgi:hypothetical protein